MLKSFLLLFFSIIPLVVYAESSNKLYKDLSHTNETTSISLDSTKSKTNQLDSTKLTRTFKSTTGVIVTEEQLSEEKGVFLEEGKYQRKSVAYLDALMILDGQYNINTQKVYKKTMKLISNNLHMGRFDYVIIPDKLKSSFIREANNEAGKMTPESLLDLVSAKLLPEIKKILVETIDIRGAANISDAQKASMIATKAKEVGLTEGQITQLMNSAYLYIPIVRGITKSVDQYNITYQVDLGVIWYQVKTQENKVVVKKMIFPQSTIGIASRSKRYSSYGGPDNFALDAALSAAVKNLVVETKMMPEFNVSGQIVSKVGNEIQVEIGNREGVELDDKVLFVMAMEDSAGNSFYKELGYGYNTYVGVNKNTENNKDAIYDPSKYHAIKNSSLIEPGIVAVEYARLGVNFGFGYENFPVKMSEYTKDEFEIPDSVSTSGSVHGLFLEMNTNVGKYIGINQLYLNIIGFTFGFNTPIEKFTTDNSGEYEFGTFSRVHFLGITKKIYFGRSAFDIDIIPEYILSSLSVTNGYNSTTYSYDAFSVAAGASYEFSISKNFDFKGGLSLSLFDTDKNIDYGGLRLGAQFVYSPGQLPFDPMTIIKGQLSD